MVHALRIRGTGLFAYFKPKWAKKKKLAYFPLNPGCSIGILISYLMKQSPHNWVGFHPLHTLLVFFHCSNVGKYTFDPTFIQDSSGKNKGGSRDYPILNMIHNPGADDCILDGGQSADGKIIALGF